MVCVLVKLNCIKSRMEKDIRLHTLEEKKTASDTVRQKQREKAEMKMIAQLPMPAESERICDGLQKVFDSTRHCQ